MTKPTTSPSAAELVRDIRTFLRGDVADDDQTRKRYSRDYSLFQVMPQVVVFPRTVDDVRRLVAYVAKRRERGDRVSLTGRSAGTDMTGGPLTSSIVVSFPKYFNHIVQIGTDEATVEPGVYFRDFEAALAEKGLMYPPYPASKELCAMGGIISNNSGGEKTLAYGKTQDFVRSLDVVLRDGNIHTLAPLSGDQLQAKLHEKSFEGNVYRQMHELLVANADVIQRAKPQVSKNSAGYALWNVWDGKTMDLSQLFVGSQGTLGLLVRATVRVVKPKQHSSMAVIFLNDMRWIADLVNEVLAFHPESVESYDDKTLGLAMRFLPDLLRHMKGSLFALAWKFLPEVGMVLKGGMPKMVLLVDLTDDDAETLHHRRLELQKQILSFAKSHQGIQIHLLKDKMEEEKYWAIRRESFALLHGRVKDKDTAPFIDDFAVQPSVLPQFMPELDAILAPYQKDLIYTIAGHPGNGNFHIIPLMDLKDERVRALIPEISKKVYDLVLRYHGTITAEHNDGLIRTPYLEQMFGPEMTHLFAEVKRIFDPDDLFNPGKKVDGDLAYSLAHISSARPD